MSARRRSGLLTVGLAVVLAAASWWLLRVGPLISWQIAINMVTFLTFGYDKLIAGSGRVRVPEAVLLALTFLGGTLGALAAMALFRHKTLKRIFRRKLFVVVALQVVFILVFLLVIRPGPWGEGEGFSGKCILPET